MLALVLMVSCTSSYDRVENVCRWREHVDRWGVYEHGTLDGDGTDAQKVLEVLPTYPSQHCLEVMAREMRFDIGELEELSHELPDGRENLLIGMTYEGTYDPLTVVAGGLRFPFLFDLGHVEDLTPSSFVSSAFIEAMEEESRRTGESELGPLLYSYIRENSEGGIRSTPLDGAAMKYSQRHQTISVDVNIRSHPLGSKPLSTFVHEARHLDGPAHTRVWPADGGGPPASVDMDDTGSHAFGLAVTTLVFRHIDATDAAGFVGHADQARAMTRLWAYHSMKDMMPFIDENLELTPAFDGFLDGEMDHLFWE